MRFRWAGLLIAIVIACGIFACDKSSPPAPPATRAVATGPTTTSKPTTVSAAPVTLFELLRREQPNIATTKPLGVPVDFGDAARFVFQHPIFLDEAGHLWVTLPDAEPAEAVVRSLADSGGRGESTHLVRERVKLVYWSNIAGKVSPNVIIEKADGSLAMATPAGMFDLPAKHAFQFNRALSLNDGIAIPCDNGVSVLSIGDTVTEQFQPLLASKDPLTQPQVIHGVRGLIAWTPASPAHAGSGVARFVDHQWTTLPEADWPTSIVQLTPFLDGSVQQLRQADGGKIEIASAVLDTPTVDEKHVGELVDQLGDLSESVRNKATDELERMGPSVWPILQKLSNDQLPEVQQRLAIILAGANTPSIGPMIPVDGKLRVIARYANSGILLYADAGVTMPQTDKLDPATIAPAWICVQPDEAPQLMPELLVADIAAGQQPLVPNLVQADFKMGSSQLMQIGDDWYRTDPILGPRRFVGNALLPVLRPSEKKFWLPIGSDRRGRWLFRQPGKDVPTLLIDPTIQDPTPRLPVWTIRVKKGSVGWTKEGWPAIKRGGVWALHENGWQAVDETKDPLIAYTAPKNPPPAEPTTDPATTQPTGPALLVDQDGTSFYDGKLSLTATFPKLGPARWELPATATGVDPVTLIKTPDGKLFLFNQPGRILRIAEQPGQAEPFKVEATFSKNIPSMDSTRIWLDPAGRICMVYDTNIAVLFPDGAIPHEISVIMSADELKANDPE